MMKQKGDRISLRIALIYIAFASAFFFLSDLTIRWLIADNETRSALQSVTGMALLILSAMFLYVILKRYFLQLRMVQTEHEKERGRRMGMERSLENYLSGGNTVFHVWEINEQTLSPLWISDNVQNVFGVKTQDLSLLSQWDKNIHPEDLEIASARIPLLFEKGNLTINYRLNCKDDAQLWVYESLKMIDGGTKCVGSWTDITEIKQQAEMLRQQTDRLKTLREIDIAIMGSLDIRLTFKAILTEVINQLNVDAAAILRLQPHSQALKYEAWRGFNVFNPEDCFLKIGEGYAGRAVRNKETFYGEKGDSHDTGEGESALMEEENFSSCYALPLIAKGCTLGVLDVFAVNSLSDRTRDWKQFLDTLAVQAAFAIENVQMFQDLERSNQRLIEAYDSTIEGWAYALEMKDEETKDHSRRVTDMTLKIAGEMGMDDEELAHVRRGALLHDIGKMCISDSILLKKETLTEQEWNIIRKHPVMAYEMLSGVEYLHPAIDIPYCHHERWDGNGYPRGLKGKEIPLQACIFAVVDVWDALTSKRPYKEAWGKEKSLEHIRALAGRHFNPKVVEVFCNILERERQKTA